MLVGVMLGGSSIFTGLPSKKGRGTPLLFMFFI